MDSTPFGPKVGKVIQQVGLDQPRNPWPKAWDIVDCRFPEVVGVPGPKERPALVLQIEESAEEAECCVVLVAYATSQNTQRIYSWEFVVPASVISGLTKDTKFDLVNRHALPFNDVWFTPASKTKPPHPTRGKFDLVDYALKRKLHAAILEAENIRMSSPSKAPQR